MGDKSGIEWTDATWNPVVGCTRVSAMEGPYTDWLRGEVREVVCGEEGIYARFKSLAWVIAGGESGPHARAVNPEWVRSLRDQCVEAGVPFHFKQWGGRTAKAGGRLLDGRTWDEYPEART